MFGPLVPFRGYAVDPQDQAQQAADAQPVEAGAAPPSDQPRESESGVMNRLIRLAGGWLGRDPDDEASGEPGREQPDAQPAPTDETVTLTRAELDAKERDWQSKKDREVAQVQAQIRRDHALEQAESGNLEPIRKLAEAGDRWAHRQLAERGDTWALGEIEQQRLAREEATEGFQAQVQSVAAHLDQAYFEPLVALVDDPALQARIRAEAVGVEGRTKAVQTILKRLESRWKHEAVTTALENPEFVGSLFKNESFLKELRTGSAASKALSAHYRGDREDPALAPGLGRGAGGDRENDVMNEAIRGAWRLADLAAPEERSAMAGSRNGGVTHRDLLDDD